MAGELFQTQRSKLVEVYRNAGVPFEATTQPYKSQGTFVGEIVSPEPSVAAATMAHLVFRAGQEVTLFTFGEGDSIPDGFGGQYRATDAETNQASGSKTNGAVDFVIEGVSASMKGARIQYPAGTAGTAGVPITDKDLVVLYNGTPLNGQKPPPMILDPAALATPPQMFSPFNLEQTLMTALAPSMAVEFEFDRKKTFHIGTMDEIPEGGAKSFLRSNGDPRTDNRYRIPEGFMWRRAGEPDSDFAIILTLWDPVVIPITIIGLFGATQSPVVIPTNVAVDITMRVHGLNVSPPSNN